LSKYNHCSVCGKLHRLPLCLDCHGELVFVKCWRWRCVECRLIHSLSGGIFTRSVLSHGVVGRLFSC
jgi:hypothetical protein